MNRVCRTCLSESKESKFINVVNKMFGNESVLELVIQFASIKILRNDPLPQVVCTICLEKLNLLHKFRQIVLNSDITLKNKLLVDEHTFIKSEETNKPKCISQVDERKFRNQVVETENNIESNSVNTPQNALEPNLSKHVDEHTSNTFESTQDISNKSNVKCNSKSQSEGITLLAEQKIKKRKYECRQCNKVFKKGDHYKIHMTVHTGEKKYACEFCPKRFARSYVLVYHRRVHTGERPYTCDVCSKSFSSPSNFYTHKKVHSGEKNYKCEICEESFIQSDSLKIHIRRIHTGERPFLCEICSSRFRSNSSLLTHKLDMHGEKEACPLCNKLYSSRVLKEHIRRHKEKEQGIKRYACDQCGKRFTCSSSRKKHLLIHSGEKPYSCEVCEKSFNQRSALKTHMRVHSDFKQFPCDFCSKSFRYKHHLRSHNSTHHKEVLQEENNCD